MKKININKLTEDVAEKVNLLGNVLGSFGNNNIRGCHIGYFEKKLIEENENQKSSLASAPNYFAWVVIFSEHIFWLIREFCYHQHELKTPSNFSSDYNTLLRVFADKCDKISGYSENEIEEMFECIIKVLIVRHAFVHGGFPNILPATMVALNKQHRPTRQKADQCKGYSKEEVKKVVDTYSNPMNFSEIKNRYDRIITFMKKAGGVSIGF